jgi:hypothetical protein
VPKWANIDGLKAHFNFLLSYKASLTAERQHRTDMLFQNLDLLPSADRRVKTT